VWCVDRAVVLATESRARVVGSRSHRAAADDEDDDFMDFSDDSHDNNNDNSLKRQQMEANRELRRIQKQRTVDSNPIACTADKVKAIIYVPSLCHRCWASVFPCRPVAFHDQRAQVEHILVMTHGLSVSLLRGYDLHG
jgi:hypothetical protein